MRYKVRSDSQSHERIRSITFRQDQKATTYLKAITLRDFSDIHFIKDDIDKNMILVLRVTPLAQKDVDELKKAVKEIYAIVKSSGADIARLGEERIIVTPPSVKIWRTSAT